MRSSFFSVLLTLALLTACGGEPSAPPDGDGTAKSQTQSPPAAAKDKEQTVESSRLAYVKDRLDIYAPVTLSADLNQYSDKQRKMIAVLIEASKIMDRLYWEQAYGNRRELMRMIGDRPTKRFARINYGPWDRLNDNKPFVEDVGPKPPGANFYPEDMSKEEFAKAGVEGKTSLYTLIRRDEQGSLIAVPYHEAYKRELERAAKLLREAAELAEHEGFKHYLELRADALLTSEYRKSDLAWMDMSGNPIGLVYGPIETYEDQLFGYKAAFEAYVLLKDMAWSERLSRFAEFLPELQDALPVPEEYKQEEPGLDADLNAYDAIYYAGQANAGAKTIAINLPNDEYVQLNKGTRRLQLKNAMRAKFDKILVPIAGILIAGDQRGHITFDAFFQNTMFHEVAHGLGIKNTITGKGTVREALKEHASSMEEGKADILGLYMIQKLHEMGELEEGELMDNYVSFLASIFRSVRFGASSAHGVANMVRFNYFKEQGAFTRDEETGTYRVNREKFEQAMTDLSRKILTLQGDGDYAATGAFLEQYGKVGPQLQADLQRLAEAGIPVDIVFEQGKRVLGLNRRSPD